MHLEAFVSGVIAREYCENVVIIDDDYVHEFAGPVTRPAREHYPLWVPGGSRSALGGFAVSPGPRVTRGGLTRLSERAFLPGLRDFSCPEYEVMFDALDQLSNLLSWRTIPVKYIGFGSFYPCGSTVNWCSSRRAVSLVNGETIPTGIGTPAGVRSNIAIYSAAIVDARVFPKLQFVRFLRSGERVVEERAPSAVDALRNTVVHEFSHALWNVVGEAAFTFSRQSGWTSDGHLYDIGDEAVRRAFASFPETMPSNDQLQGALRRAGANATRIVAPAFGAASSLSGLQEVPPSRYAYLSREEDWGDSAAAFVLDPTRLAALSPSRYWGVLEVFQIATRRLRPKRPMDFSIPGETDLVFPSLRRRERDAPARPSSATGAR